MRIERHATGARLVQGGAVLSEILSSPGATHSVFDLLAAGIAMHPRADARVGLLGFAGGGIVGPLRALENDARIEACDLDPTGWELFLELTTEWRGEVETEIADAVDWIAKDRSKFDVVLEDLSCLGEDDEETKPAVSVTTLPKRIARRTNSRDGYVVTNLLPVPGVSWRSLQAQIASPWPRAVIVELDEWENRVLFAGPGIPTARQLGRALGQRLEALGSDLTHKFRARELRDL